MKAISLWQPWASLWLTTAKVHETRHWETSYRGPLAIHAAQRLVTDVGLEVDEICIQQFGPKWRVELPRGAVVGAVRLIDCVPTSRFQAKAPDLHCGDFSPGRFGWRRDISSRLSVPLLFKGKQGFFNVPDELLGEFVPVVMGDSNVA